MKYIAIPDQRLVHGSFPPLTHSLHADCGGCSNLSEESCYQALEAIKQGVKPDNDAWHSIYQSVDEPWAAETGGAIYTEFFSSETDALEFRKMNQSTDKDWGILSWCGSWVYVSWFAPNK
jgi:hypothetical protein